MHGRHLKRRDFGLGIIESNLFITLTKSDAAIKLKLMTRRWGPGKFFLGIGILLLLQSHPWSDCHFCHFLTPYISNTGLGVHSMLSQCPKSLFADKKPISSGFPYFLDVRRTGARRPIPGTNKHPQLQLSAVYHPYFCNITHPNASCQCLRRVSAGDVSAHP